MPSDQLRKVRDAVVAQRTALIERAALLAIGLAIAGWNLYALGSVSLIGTFRSLPFFAGVTVALLAVSEFLPEERTTAILAIRLIFLALALVTVAFGALLLLFMANNTP